MIIIALRHPLAIYTVSGEPNSNTRGLVKRVLLENGAYLYRPVSNTYIRGGCQHCTVFVSAKM